MFGDTKAHHETALFFFLNWRVIECGRPRRNPPLQSPAAPAAGSADPGRSFGTAPRPCRPARRFVPPSTSAFWPRASSLTVSKKGSVQNSAGPGKSDQNSAGLGLDVEAETDLPIFGRQIERFAPRAPHSSHRAATGSVSPCRKKKICLRAKAKTIVPQEKNKPPNPKATLLCGKPRTISKNLYNTQHTHTHTTHTHNTRYTHSVVRRRFKVYNV